MTETLSGISICTGHRPKQIEDNGLDDMTDNQALIQTVNIINSKVDRIDEKLTTIVEDLATLDTDVRDLKRLDLATLDTDVRDLKRLDIEKTIEEFKPVWERSKKDYEKKDELILGGQKTFLNWLIIALLGLIFAGLIADITLRLHNTPTPTQSTQQKTTP